MPPDCLLVLAELPVPAASIDPASWLDNGERARLSTISAEHRRREFLGGHWLARLLACEHFGGEPGDWRWCTDPGGKPRLQRAGWMVEIAVSHSASSIACAVATEPVGLDLEIGERERDWLALARHVLSDAESQSIAALAAAERGAEFIARWALHEALGKRDGEGVMPSRMRRCQFVECEPDVSDLRSWPLPGGTLALAVSAKARIECRGLERASPSQFWRCLQA